MSLKDNEDNEKTATKSKKGVKFALKTTKQRKVLKRIGTVDHIIVNKKMRILQCKNKEEKKTEENDILLEHNKFVAIEQEKTNECTETEANTSVQLSIQNNLSSTKVIIQGAPNTNIEHSLSKL